jgi:hypothetical protein
MARRDSETGETLRLVREKEEKIQALKAKAKAL